MNPSRKPLIAGNWKMFHGDHSGALLASECAQIARATINVEMLIAPPYTALAVCAAACRESPLVVAAQNLHTSEQGACTGEISAATIKDAGCTWVILGHSERRRILAESDELVAEKVDAALAAGLSPIVCVGETLAQREAGHALRVVRLQVDAVSPLLARSSLPVAIAYEPLWAIGAGKSATPDDVETTHSAIRGWLRERDAKLAEAARLLYGGSVIPDNAAPLFACSNVDGALVGGGSLSASEFGAIARVASQHGLSERP